MTYPGRDAPAVAGVSLDLAPGTCLLVVGPSGSGKSTLAVALAGLVPWAVPARLAGELRIDDRSVPGTDPAALVDRVGVVFQDPSSQLVMERVADDVAFGLEGRAWPREAMIPRVPEALAAAGLAGFERRRTARLSGGEQQRLALAGALAPRPGLLVLDEPTANLDPAGAAAFAGRLAAVRAARAATIVLVEHRADLAWPLADVVLALGADGTPLALGAPGELLAGRRADLAGAGIWLPDESLPAPVAASPTALRGREPGPERGQEPGPERGREPGPERGQECPERAPERAREPLATMDAVEFSFTRGVPVLRGVDLAIGPGERVALLGANGSGKSTVLRLLVGLLRPTSGSIRLAGHEPAALRPRDLARLAGYVTQDPERGFVDGTVEGELLAGLEAPERGRVGDVAAALGLPLDRFGSRNPHTLSGGEQRRLSLATQLVRRPRLLALDEPTYGQDRATYDALVALLGERIAGGAALVAATHDLRFAAELGGRRVRLEAGRIAGEDAPGLPAVAKVPAVAGEIDLGGEGVP